MVSMCSNRIQPSDLSIPMALVSSCCFSCSGILFKVSEIDSLQTTFLFGVSSFLVGMLHFFSMARKVRKAPYKSYIKSALLGLIMGSISNFCYIFAMIHWNIGDVNVTATSVNFLASIIYERFFLNVKPHWLTISAALVGLSGLVSICKPNGGNEDYELFTNIIILVIITGGATINSVYLGFLQKIKSVPTFWHSSFYACGLMFIGPFLFVGEGGSVSWEPCDSFYRLLGVLGMDRKIIL